MAVENGSDWANPLIIEHIGPHDKPYYVYLLVDPQSDEVFYVGKGTGWRFAAHLGAQGAEDHTVPDEEVEAKRARIMEIRARGQEPRVEFARIQIETEAAAYLIEATLIDVLHRYGGRGLTNAVRGHNADLGLISLEDLVVQLAAPPLDTDLRAILIKLGWWTPDDDAELPRRGYGYYPGMSDQELYDSVRAWWRIGTYRGRSYPYAVAVFQGITRAIYEIDHETWRARGADSASAPNRRWAFAGMRLREGPAFDAFIGTRGKRIPPSRPDGRAVFGTGSPIAYWPH
jgi:hypothetical protein